MPPVHDSAVASVRPCPRQSSSTISEIERSSSREQVDAERGAERVDDPRARSLGVGLDEDVDVDLELARADGHVDSFTLAARACERLRDGGLRRAEEAKDVMNARGRALEHAAHRLCLERARPQPLQLARRAREHDDDASTRV